ncbi:MAG: penicillin-binding transpeptidase domain-containing protein [Chloroflexota bacterium]
MRSITLRSRPALLLLLALLAAFVIACGGGSGDTAAVVTAVPKNPRDAAERWLELWKDGKYDEMYSLVSAKAAAGITKQDFVDRYTAIYDEARLTGFDYEIRTSAKSATQVEFKVTFHSSFFDDWPEVNTIPLVQDSAVAASSTGTPAPNLTDDWKVDWTPSLFFKGIAGDDLVHFFTKVPKRGTIFDRQGKPLAVDATLPVVGVVRDAITDPEAVVSGLVALGIPEADVRAQINSTLPSYYFLPVKTLDYGTPDDQVQKFRDLVSLGVVVQDKTTRLYPNGDSAAHILGYMTEVSEDQLKTLSADGFQPGDKIGASGLEGQYNDQLAGKRGGLLATVTPQGTIDQTVQQKSALAGQDLWLAINEDVQKRAEAELGTRTGALVVMDPRDNSVLAMASYPRFDPNAFIRGLTSDEANKLFNDPQQPFLNRAVLAQYPPGSTFKPVTLAAGLEKGGYTPDSSLPCPPVWEGLGEKYAQKNWQTVDRGYLTPSEGLMASCDPVFYEMGKTLDEIDENLFPEFIRQFGYGSPTGIGIEEAAGNVPDPKWKEDNIGEAWFTGDAVNMAIGQGFVTATPMQIVNVYSALAKTADLRTPLLVWKLTQGAAAQEFAAKEIHPLPIQQSTLDAIRYGLYLVTQSPSGTSYAAWVGTSLDVAGKSGTAEDLSQGSDHVFFAAYANRSDPNIVALGALEEGQSGSAEVAPMLRHIMEAYEAGELGSNAALPPVTQPASTSTPAPVTTAP